MGAVVSTMEKGNAVRRHNQKRMRLARGLGPANRYAPKNPTHRNDEG